MTFKLSILVGTLAAWASSASAQIAPFDPPARPALRAQVTVHGDVVRVGDFIEKAGLFSEKPVFRAPDLGSTGSVPTARIVEALRAHGLIGVDTRGLGEVVVHRASRSIELKEIEALIAGALAAHINVSDPASLVMTFDHAPRPIHLDPDMKASPRVAAMNYSGASQRFDVTLEAPAGPRLRYTGTAFEGAPVLILARAVARGETIRSADLIVERKPRAQAGESIGSIEEAAGLATRRALRAGHALRASDLMKPEVVRANETVTITYEMPGLTLTVRGKAIENGAEGDTISVTNIQSKRTIQATVVGTGHVMVAANARNAEVARSTAMASRAVQQRTE